MKMQFENLQNKNLEVQGKMNKPIMREILIQLFKSQWIYHDALCRTAKI